MIQSIKIKRLGNHLYPDLIHEDPTDLCLDPKIERIISRLGSIESEIVFYEQYDIVADFGILQFKEEDIVKYLTTDDSFNIHFYIDGHEFTISSELYTLLELQYNFNFHKTLYRVEIW